jgi:hypothetical protein
VGLSLSLLLTYTRENRSFEQLGVWSRGTENVTDGIFPEEVTTLNVSLGTLRALGIQPALGRWFSEEDDIARLARDGHHHGWLWGRRFGRDPAIVGRQVAVDSRPRWGLASCRQASVSSTRLRICLARAHRCGDPDARRVLLRGTCPAGTGCHGGAGEH